MSIYVYVCIYKYKYTHTHSIVSLGLQFKAYCLFSKIMSMAYFYKLE